MSQDTVRRYLIKELLDELYQRCEKLQASLELSNQVWPENLDVAVDIVRELIKVLKMLPCLDLKEDSKDQADA